MMLSFSLARSLFLVLSVLLSHSAFYGALPGSDSLDEHGALVGSDSLDLLVTLYSSDSIE